MIYNATINNISIISWRQWFWCINLVFVI